MKKILMMVAAVALVSGQAQAYNGVQITMDAVVTSSCNLDLANNTGTPLLIKEAPIADDAIVATGSNPTLALDPIPVYETCNDDFDLTFMSLNGALALDLGAGVASAVPAERVEYSISYQGSEMAAPFVATSADIEQSVVAAPQVQRLLEDKIAADGAVWSYSAANLEISLVPQAGLRVGTYSDVLAIDMSAAQ